MVAPSAQGENYVGLQALRAAAALLVVIFHALEAWDARVAAPARVAWPNGSAGVDLFFVISGFVMSVSSRRLGLGARASRRFLVHRLRRIVPLYWVFNGVKLAAVLAAPALAMRTSLGIGYVAASLLFLPVHDGTGAFKPLLPVGWTLSFEMMFYALFAAGLWLRMASPLVLLPVLAGLALLPLVTGAVPGGVAGELCHPIVLEFGLGIALACWLPRCAIGTGAAPVLLAGVLLAGAWTLLLLDHWHSPWERLVALGLPAGGIVGCTVILEPWMRRWVPRVVLLLGDASYAIYLSHGFVVAALAAAFGGRLGLALWSGAVSCACALIGVGVHLWLERPLLALFRARPRVLAPA